MTTNTDRASRPTFLERVLRLDSPVLPRPEPEPKEG